MKAEDILRQPCTPLGSPAYPMGPYRFHRREYLNITYRTDMDAVRALVPEPLEVIDPIVRFEIIRMPDTTGLGDYTESGQVISVRFNGEEGEYVHAMYVDSHPAIASGREVAAFPKKLGKPSLRVDSDTLLGSLDYGSVRVATATMGYKQVKLSNEEALTQLCGASFMLKLVPGYDRKPRICELVRTQLSDVTITEAWTGPARLQLFEHAIAPLADFPVRKVISASHIVTELSLAKSVVVHDYLAAAATK